MATLPWDYVVRLADLDPEIPSVRLSLALPPERSGYDLLLGRCMDIRPRATIFERGPWTDYVGTDWPSAFLVSARFQEFLVANRLQGWRPQPIDLEAIPDAEAPGYVGLAITGRCGRVRPTRDGLGKTFDPRAWDGSDFLIVEGYGAALVTPRAAGLLAQGRFSNLVSELASLEPLDDDTTNPDPKSQELKVRVARLVNELTTGIASKRVDTMLELVDVGECKVALENLAENLYDIDAVVPSRAFDELLWLAEVTGARGPIRLLRTSGVEQDNR